LKNFEISYLDKIKSTNDFCFDLIKKSISSNGIVFSDHQTKGRGRYGKKWISKKGNVFCSIYKIAKNHKDILKEPNDILIKNKKISGILIESIKFKKKLFLVVGIGINIVSSPKIKDYRTTFLNRFLKNKVQKIHFVNFLKKNINNI
jgi:BirA family biotin operon repressor/biotin-[acetyl-CoA-carboxylase] ligase